MPKDLKRLRHYIEKLRIGKDEFPCPDCGHLLLPRIYEKHCVTQHGFNGKLGCVWCRNVNWASGTKCDHADHLLACFRGFLVPTACTAKKYSTATVDSTKLRLLDMTPSFPVGDCFGIENNLGYWAHEHPRKLDVDDPLLFPRLFPDDSLHLASAYVRHFLESKFDWFHVMVRSVAWESFLDAMHGHPESRCLEFSCWCDGGGMEEARYRQHRHLVVVSPKDRFLKEVWPKVKPDSRPYPNYRCKKEKRIETAMHLANTLGYLSGRRSRCRFSFEKSGSKAFHRDNHFHLYRSMPREFLLPLCVLWEGGLVEFLDQTKIQNAEVMRIVERALVYQDGRWQQTMGDFYRFEGGLVLPVMPDLAPSLEGDDTHVVLHLMGGRKLYLVHRPEIATLDRDGWLRRQAEGGNCFFDVVRDEYWSPRPRDQSKLNLVKPLVDRIGELESENATLKRKCEMSNVCKRPKRRIDAENLRIGHEEGRRYLEAELERLRGVDLQLRNEIVLVKHEKMRSENRCALLEIENERLKNRYARVLENENSQLRSENAQLKIENAQLKNEIVQLKNEIVWLKKQLHAIVGKQIQAVGK